MTGSRTPAQVAAFVIGAWWTLNGVAALIAEGSNLAVADVQRKRQRPGAVRRLG